MRTWIKAALTLPAILLAGMTVCFTGEARAASLSGGVTQGELGMGIEGALVALLFPNTPDSLIATAITDHDGFYFIDGLEPGTVSVLATHPDFHPFYEFLLLEAGGNVLDIPLQPIGNNPAWLEGWVLDGATGLPVVEALVSYHDNPMSPPVEDFTNSDGHFELGGLHSGLGVLNVIAPGYHPFTEELVLEAGGNQSTITLIPLEQNTGTSVVGIVLDLMTREPLAGARVCASPGVSGLDSLCTLANEAGVFTLTLPPSNVDGWWLTASAAGHVSSSMWVHGAQDHVWIEFLLQPTGEPLDWGVLAGQVRRADEPQGGVELEAIRVNNPGWGYNYFAQTGPMGHYELAAPAGSYRLACHAVLPNGVVQTVYYPGVPTFDNALVLELEEGEFLSGLDFDLPGEVGDTLRVLVDGQVTDQDGQPLPGALVRVWTEQEELVDSAVLTDDQGRFQTIVSEDRLPIVPFSLSAELAAYQMEFFSNAPSFMTATQFLLSSDGQISNLDFTLDAQSLGGAVSGQVTGEGDAPPSGLVAALSPDGEFVTSTAARIDGGYNLNGLPDRELVLLFYAPGYLPVFSGGGQDLNEAQRVDPNADVTWNASLMPLQPPAGPVTVLGRISGDAGQDVEGALVMARTPANDDLRFSFSGANGSYAVTDVSSGADLELRVSAPGWEVGELTLHTNSAQQQTMPMDIQLLPLQQNDVPRQGSRPEGIHLSPASPNPFNPYTTLRFTLSQVGDAVLTVHDLRGALVWEQRFPNAAPGEHRVIFDGSGLSSGLYLMRLESAGQSATERMLLLK